MRIVIRTAVVLLALFCFCAVPALALDKYAVTVDRLHIKRGNRPFTVRAIATPDACKPGTSKEQVARTLNLAGEVGANTILVDVFGISGDGASVSDEALQAIRFINEIGADRGALGIVHLTGPAAPKSDGARLAWIRTAATVFARDTAYLYLIDGDDAGKLARAFKRASNHLTVASPKFGDVDVVQPGEKSRKKPQILMGALPKELDETNFILPADRSSYAKLDAACALPEEAQTWAPDDSSLSPEERAQGFKALFDGKTFNGWVVLGAKKDAWSIKDGVVERVSAGSQGLRTIRRFAHFDLRWEWNLPHGGNNGVHFCAPRAQRESRLGFEYQMLGDYGKQPDKDSTGSIYDVVPPTVNAVKPEGEWNSSEIIFDGSHIIYFLNGQKVNDVNIDDNEELRPRLRKGFIVLTEHNDVVMYRNIRIKELP